MPDEQEQRIKLLAEGIAADIKSLVATRGDLTSLTTINKTSLVAALNEVSAASPTGVLFSAQNLADLQDPSVSRVNLGVLSDTQVTEQITAAVAALTLAGLGGLNEAEVDARAQSAIAANIGMAPETLNTIQEIAAELASDDTAFATLSNLVTTKVSFTPQTLDAAQRLQACLNIGVGNPDRDFLADYVAARDA